MNNPDLDKDFKDSDNPFRIVFVCAMWLTGFDVKSLSCLYLDKPLKAHTLMQAIARANRVNEGKSNGLIIDYIGIVKALRKALADYTVNASTAGTDPTIDKDELIKHIRELLSESREVLSERGFSLDELVNVSGMEKVRRLHDAVNAVCSPDTVKKSFSALVSELLRISRYADRDDMAYSEIKERNALAEIYNALHAKPSNDDTTELMVRINEIISRELEMEGQGISTSTRFDISAIDFGLLAKEFQRAKNKALVFKDLQSILADKLDKMCSANPTRIDFYERFQKIIEEYNKDQDRAEIEKIFQELIDFASELTEEEARVVREGFTSDEELAIFDKIKAENLSRADIAKVKKVSIELLQAVKDQISKMDHWVDKDETKATVSNTIRNLLYSNLPESYDWGEIDNCREQVFEYVYNRYSGLVS